MGELLNSRQGGLYFIGSTTVGANGPHRESAALLQSFESPTIAILRVSSLDAAIDLFAGYACP